IHLRDVAGTVEELARLPELADFSHLGFDYQDTSSSLHEPESTLLAASPYLTGLRSLDVSNNGIGPEAITALARNPALRGREGLGVEWCWVEEGVAALARATFAPTLRSLAIGTGQTYGGHTEALLGGGAFPALAHLAIMTRCVATLGAMSLPTLRALALAV